MSDYAFKVGDEGAFEGREDTYKIIHIEKNVLFCLKYYKGGELGAVIRRTLQGTTLDRYCANLLPPKPKPIVRWFNVYKDDCVCQHKTKRSARGSGTGNLDRLACVRIEIPYEIGEGLDDED